MSSNPTLTVQLVTYNGAEFLPACLRSLEAQTYRDWQLCVLDNGSRDGCVALLKSAQHLAELQLNERNIGFAPGHNALMLTHHSPYVCILNQDTVLEPNYLVSLVDAMEKYPNAASASGVLLRMERGSGDAWELTDTIDAAGLTHTPWMSFAERQRGVRYERTASAVVTSVFGVPATAAIYRRAALDAVAHRLSDHIEYFDSVYISYKEDVDIAWRLKRKGWDALVTTAAIGYHARSVRPVTSRTPLARWEHYRRRDAHLNEQFYRNHLMVLFKNLTWADWWRLPLIAPYEIAKSLALFLRTPQGLLRAWRFITLNYQLLWSKRTITS